MDGSFQKDQFINFTLSNIYFKFAIKVNFSMRVGLQQSLEKTHCPPTAVTFIVVTMFLKNVSNFPMFQIVMHSYLENISDIDMNRLGWLVMFMCNSILIIFLN